MSKKVNIQGLVNNDDDIFYRYKMEKINVISQKNKTIIDNLAAVSKDLERDPEIIITFLKKKFGAPFSYKKNILITSKPLSFDEINKELKEFIEYYVLCQQCRLPETTIIKFDKKLNQIHLLCKCCSFHSCNNI